MGKKDKEKKESGGGAEGLPSTEFMIKPETATPKLDTSKCVCRRWCSVCCCVLLPAVLPLEPRATSH
jgi:hypothetical protein